TQRPPLDRGHRRWHRRRRPDPRQRPARPRRPRVRARRASGHRQPARSRHTRLRRAAMRLIIADDSVLLRASLAEALGREFDVVGQAGDADELLALVTRYQPDAAIVDIRMPPTFTDEGLRAADHIRSLHPATGVLVLSQYLQTAYAVALVSAGPERMGYLL